MKNLLIITTLIFYCQAAKSQTFEIAEDNGHRNIVETVINVGDSMWVAANHYFFGTVGEHGSQVKAVDNNGNTIWEYPQPGTITDYLFLELVQFEGDKIVALGIAQLICDVAQSTPVVMLIFNLEGDLLSTHLLDINFAPWSSEYLQSISSSEVIFLATKNMSEWTPEGSEEYNQLIATNETADILWSVNFGLDEILHLTNLNENAAVFFENQILVINDQGVRIDSVSYAEPPSQVISFNNSLLAIWPDGVYTINEFLEIELVINFAANSSTRLLYNDDLIYLVSDNQIIPFNTDFESQTPSSFNPLPYFTSNNIAISNNALAFAGSKKFEDVAVGNQSAYRSGVVYTVSLDGEQLNHFPDLAIGSFWIETPTVVQTHNNPMLFTIDVDVAGYIVNTGDVTVNRANVTFIGDQGICGFSRESVSLENISLAPGDSVYFELSELRYTQQHFPSGSGSRTFCVFVSAPNNLSDRDETNDISCVSHSFTVGLSEYFNNSTLVVYPNPATDQIFIQSDNREFPADATFNLFDLQGRLHLSNNLQSGSTIHQIDMSHLSSGIYFLQCATPGEVLWRGKVVKN
jgi:hypothetical protein